MSEQNVQNVLRTQRYGVYFRMLDKILIDQIIPDCPICGYNLITDHEDEIGISQSIPRIRMVVRCTNTHTCGLEVTVEALVTKDGPAYQEMKARRLNRSGGLMPPGQWPEPRPATETPADGRANRQINM